MKRFLSALCAVAVFALPIAALADSFKVGNLTTRSLHFEVRCNDGNDNWHTFTLRSFASRDFMSGDWNYSCDAESYQLRIGTNEDDGSTQWNTTNIRVGDSYALVNSRQKNGYTAYNTRNLVALYNNASHQVHVTYRCTDGTDDHGVDLVQPSKVGWFYVPGCNEFSVSTTTRENDGSTTTHNHTINPNNVYRIIENGNGDYDVVKM